MNFVKAPPMCFDFDVAVTGNGVQVTSPQLDMRITLEGEVPDNLLELTAHTAYRFCLDNNIPVGGDVFVVTKAGVDLQEGGSFQGLFVPEPALRH